jgi:hypothetical protein
MVRIRARDVPYTHALITRVSVHQSVYWEVDPHEDNIAGIPDLNGLMSEPLRILSARIGLTRR